ncbi:hypothetical protein F5X98DRAFT_361532 [Xylaria grammica]|nr:hypothetical protein F5X98DRAFT_361532 [Xylaria grammica]
MEWFCIAPRCGLCRFDFVKNEDRLTGYYLVLRLFDATSYAYEPWPSENIRRFRWMCSRLALIIYWSLALRLPYELCDTIARYCVCEYAFYISRNFCEGNVASNFRIELSKPIWARYASLDGIAYIASLANEPIWSDSVLLPRPNTPIKMVYVAEDHLGVSEVHFAGSLDKGRHHSTLGLWWRTVRSHEPELEGQTDGSKLRRLFCPATGDTPGRSVLWATPQLYPERLRLTMWIKSPNPPKMVSLNLGQEVTGYSFCWNGYIVALKAHHHEEDLSYYDYFTSSYPYALWLYIPLRPRERITEIWQRRRRHGIEVALIAVTNIDRIHIMGAYPKSCWRPCSYELLYKAELGEGSFFIDESPAGIHAIASGSLAGSTVSRSLPILASSQYPKSMSFEDYLYTKASVENVTHVRLCRAKPDFIITGLVFEYVDGHQESVGEVRLDCLEAPILIHVCQKMWLRVSRSSYGFPQVVDVGFSPASRFGEEYISIIWHGFLEWWFSLNQCKLYHNGQASLSTRR